jgi:hypothetical protein
MVSRQADISSPECSLLGQANAGDSSTGMKANIAGLLCYVLGWGNRHSLSCAGKE